MAPRDLLSDLSSDYYGEDDTLGLLSRSRGTGSIGSFNTLDEGLSLADQRSQSLRSQQNELQKLSLTPDTLDGAQAGAATLLATLPMLIGAGMYGSRGVEATAPAAIAGAGGYLSGIKDENDRNRQKTALELKAVNDEIAGVNQQRNQLQMQKIRENQPTNFERTYDAKVRLFGKPDADKWASQEGTGNNISIQLPRQGSADLATGITSNIKVITGRRAFINEMVQDFPELAKVDPNNSSISSLPGRWLEATSGLAFGADTPRGEQMSRFQSQMANELRDISGLSATDKEFVRTFTSKAGSGWVSPPDMAKALRLLEKDNQVKIRQTVDLARFQQQDGNFTPEGILEFFNSPASQVAISSDGPVSSPFSGMTLEQKKQLRASQGR